MLADLQKSASYHRNNSEASVLDEPLRLASFSSLRLEPFASQQLINAGQVERGLASPPAVGSASREQQQHYLRTRSFDEMSLHNMATGLTLGRSAPVVGAGVRAGGEGGTGAGLGPERESPGEAGGLGLSFPDLQLVDIDDAASEAQSTVDSEFPGAAAGTKWPSSLTQQPLYVGIFYWFIFIRYPYKWT